MLNPVIVSPPWWLSLQGCYLILDWTNQFFGKNGHRKSLSFNLKRWGSLSFLVWATLPQLIIAGLMNICPPRRLSDWWNGTCSHTSSPCSFTPVYLRLKMLFLRYKPRPPNEESTSIHVENWGITIMRAYTLLKIEWTLLQPWFCKNFCYFQQSLGDQVGWHNAQTS